MGWAYRMERQVSGQSNPESVHGQGDELDPRFSLAGERTALAWPRFTAAAGVLVVGVHRSFGRLRHGHGPFSPLDPMPRVAVVTGLVAVFGLATSLVLVLSATEQS